MKSVSTIALGMIISLFGVLSEAELLASSPVHTNRTRFRIPFRYDPEEMQAMQAKEIRLYVSSDRGVNWHHVQTVNPVEGRFEFNAGGDAEYWFVVRTLDAKGQLHPSGEIKGAGLKVVVDTRPPAIDVEVHQTQPGQVELAWNASDANLDLKKLRLEYLQGGMESWHPVSVIPQASGRTSWSVPNGGIVAVRANVSDQASNTNSAQNQARIAPVVPAKQATPVPQPPLAMNSPSSNRSLNPDPFKETTPAVTGSNRSNPTSGQFVSSHGVHLPEPDDKTNMQHGGLATFDDAPQTPSNARVVKSRQFQIDYQVDDIGPSGVSRIEFFITQDEGKKWWKYGDDVDRQSPFPIQVPQDGTYGFAMRVHSGVGLAADPPSPGMKPEMVVIVDQTAPALELLPIRQGKGASLNKLFIQWNHHDEHPAAKPVALYYSASPDGPWEAISGWLPDEGRYIWTVGNAVPMKVYLRLTARDAAGNLTRTQTPHPVIIDLKKPTARIVDVESIHNSGVQR